MGSQGSALRKGKMKEKKCQGAAVQETTGEQTLRRQEEDTASEKLGCSEKSSALPHECTVVEVHTQR